MFDIFLSVFQSVFMSTSSLLALVFWGIAIIGLFSIVWNNLVK